jgi:hypothetical protein
MRERRRGSACAAMAAALTMLVTPAMAETLEQRVDRMERELRELRAEIRKRDAADRRRAAGGTRSQTKTVTAPPSAAPEPPAPVVADTAPPPAAPAPPVVATAPEGGRDRSALRGLMDRVAVGAYGSTRFEASSLQNQKTTFTFRRFVLTVDSDIADRLKGYMELEFERFRKLELEKTTQPGANGGLQAEQAVGGTDSSEISFEQAWLQYDIEDWIKFRAGEVLVPLGRFNLNHDDNKWDLPRRSLVDRGVSVLPVPAAWGELGVGFLGDVPVGDQGLLSYQGYVVNGLALDTEFEQIVQTRQGDTTKQAIEAKVSPSTGTFGNDVKNAKAITGRLAWSPTLGNEVGGSGYFGQYTPDYLANENLWALAADGRTGWGPFELEGEYMYTHFDGIPNVARSFARTAIQKESESEAGSVETEVEFELANLASSKQGYWLEGRYRFWPAFLNDTFLAKRFQNPQLVAVLRGEQVWLGGYVQDATFSGGRLTSFDSEDRYVSRITAGLAYRPVPLVVFQLAYEYTQTNSGQSLAGVTNFMPAGPHEDHAHSLLLGAAFGF